MNIISRKALLAGTTAFAALGLTGCGTYMAGSPMGMASASALPMVGGAPMYPTYTIVQNASAASNLTTLVAAVKAAGLVDTLSSAGPFTVFAPTNDAFAMVPSASLSMLMMPQNQASLAKVLTYHVIPGKLSARDLISRIRASGGTAVITTVEGEPLTFTMANGVITVRGMGGSAATITTADVNQSNGVVHIIDHVLMPSM